MQYPNLKPNPVMEFHISRQARNRYNFDESLFSLSGNTIFADFHAARVFAQKMNAHRDLVRFPEKAVKAGQINAMGLIDEILHVIISQYRIQKNPRLMEKALNWLSQELGKYEVEKTLRQFADEFPPLLVYRQEIHLDDYMSGETGGVPNKHILLEELIMLWLANVNPAFSPYQELFDDQNLKIFTAYTQLITNLEVFIDTQPRFGKNNETLLKLLRAPALAFPHSLTDQLLFIQDRWSLILGEFLHQLLTSLDLIREEEKPTFLGPGPAHVYEFRKTDLFEEERFSPDLDWMPRLVMLAKNAYVWLDQLSKEYNRPIIRLDDVPDQELDKLASWGITGLWLIGIWERSNASQRIKQMCGNPDAVASAYSLFDYIIADRLGGNDGLDNLRSRAWKRGIRIAADMVPNHVGIYSKWVIEHPDWFVSLDNVPFPTYTFNGDNLSEDDRVGIYLEDRYYSREDAAVVFKREDTWTGDVKYIYHGNDGTSMPWNDTAQLDFLKAEVREAVIQTILHVARNFPIIRFDAAMTLAKKHFHRLWYPQPGSGGDIPSRSEFGLSQEIFDNAMPVEFWREVVDRVSKEVPDTLLLAEAFWMMEGYFVRTLGMHRVYNSAFMNMLRDEKNDQYRQLIKNTLEFDPEILKRYVNFMNNPDEKTAIEQFGKDDKYFGICAMMSTLPGLPMIGHGQIEGYHEKYGMEYYRAYWDERPDLYLLNRHTREIFPLLHRRHLFAEVENFFLYDFYTPEGSVEENVFAYSNRIGFPGSEFCQRSLVIFHNRWADVGGWINVSAAYKDKSDDNGALKQTNLGNGLGLKNQENFFTIFRDHINGLEYIRENTELFEQGLYVELGAYKYQVFLDFREVVDNEWGQYAQLAEYLKGRGVPDIENKMQEILLEPLHYPFKEIVNQGFFKWLIDNRVQSGKPIPEIMGSVLSEAEAKLDYLFQGIKNFTEESFDHEALTRDVCWNLSSALKLPALSTLYPLPRSRNYKKALCLIQAGFDGNFSLEEGDPYAWGIIFGWLFTHNLGKVLMDTNYEGQSCRMVNDWFLDKIIAATLEELRLDPEIALNAVTCIRIMIKHQNWYKFKGPKRGRSRRILEKWLEDPDVKHYLRFNRFQKILWFNKEALESLLRWMLTAATLMELSYSDRNNSQTEDASVPEVVLSIYSEIKAIQKISDQSEYRVDNLLPTNQ